MSVVETACANNRGARSAAHVAARHSRTPAPFTEYSPLKPYTKLHYSGPGQSPRHLQQCNTLVPVFTPAPAPPAAGVRFYKTATNSKWRR
eukprot:2093699-Pyramimonas_sp.AAC.2